MCVKDLKKKKIPPWKEKKVEVVKNRGLNLDMPILERGIKTIERGLDLVKLVKNRGLNLAKLMLNRGFNVVKVATTN